MKGKIVVFCLFLFIIGSVGVFASGGSEGSSSSSAPSVCTTPSPAGPIPIPYPNIGSGNSSSDSTNKVKVECKEPSTVRTELSSSPGDDAAASGAIVSKTISGTCGLLLGSFNVKFEGHNFISLLE